MQFKKAKCTLRKLQYLIGLLNARSLFNTASLILHQESQNHIYHYMILYIILKCIYV